MTTNSPTPRPYEIWRLAFVYEDQPHVKKERPAIVAVVDSIEGMALVVKVTGHGPRPEFPGEVRLTGWEREGLEKPSTARCAKRMTVPLAAFDDVRKYGVLTPEDRVAVEETLRGLGAIV